MLFLKYFFYRVYQFFNNKKYSDADEYAFPITVFFLLLLVSGILFNMANILSIPLKINMKYKLFYILGLIIITIPIYNYLISKNRYKKFCNENYYSGTIFGKRIFGTFILWLCIMVPIALILVSAITQNS